MPEEKTDGTRDAGFERLFKHFKIQTKKEGILREVKERRFYTKPSQLKRMRRTTRRRGGMG